MALRNRLRRHFLVDYQVQGALVVRIVLYWLTCLLTVFFLILGWGMITNPTQPLIARLDELWALNGPAAVASLLLLPLVIFDLVRLSNRFAGPMFRLRRSMRDLAQGRPVAPVRFRHSDFWQLFAEDFNRVAEQAKAVKPDPVESSAYSIEDDGPSGYRPSTNIAPAGPACRVTVL
jgi:hypothetical protein